MKPSRGRCWRLVAAAALALITLAATAGEPTELDALLGQARPLLETERADAAYTLLAPHEAEYGGIPAYDYLYGMAALDTGRAAEAVSRSSASRAPSPASMARAWSSAARTSRVATSSRRAGSSPTSTSVRPRRRRARSSNATSRRSDAHATRPAPSSS